MCEYCGCRGVAPIAQLMDEHLALLDLAGAVRRLLVSGDREQAWQVLAELSRQLLDHVDREERGIFQALKDHGDFVEAVADLESEHRDFDERLSELGLGDDDLETRLGEMFADLSLHIDKEDGGIFPVAVVTLGAAGWATVARAHGTA